jgi:hypothetical protein
MKTKTVVIGDLTIEASLNSRNNLTIRGCVGKAQVLFVSTRISTGPCSLVVDTSEDEIWIGQTCIEHAELASWLATELEQLP